MVLDGQRVGDARDWVLVGFFVTCSSSAEKRFIRPAKQDEMGLCSSSSSAEPKKVMPTVRLDALHVFSDQCIIMDVMLETTSRHGATRRRHRRALDAV